MLTENIAVQGINTKVDADRVKEVLQDVWGVREVVINEKNGNALISYDEHAASITDFKQAILDAGYNLMLKKGKVETDKMDDQINLQEDKND
ncbi:heavy-metal-associated domain-containing protein [Tepidibacillus infernus]|uniref:heavy-metal-associated domain-containing protein n=1 Tax=Tepidibacillus TaxID=1494427 RepID=UPI0008535D0A|nr:heavy-metal-associated domain-containing protein [Tepidibacillus sp. HK-1]GBF11992.1 hypothetical protein HK1_02052 [Tepidibacillus sp. HK-1]